MTVIMATNEMVGVSKDVTFGYVWIPTKVYSIDTSVKIFDETCAICEVDFSCDGEMKNI